MLNQKEPVNMKRRGITIMVTALVFLLLALLVCIVLLVSKSGKEQPETSGNSMANDVLARGIVEEENADEIVSEMFNKVDEGMFECKMTTTWTFDNCDSVSSNAYVANVESNLHTLYFDVYVESMEEPVYSSPLLPIGTELRDIKLEKELGAGEYNGVVMYTLVDQDLEEVSTVGFSITILVNH